MGHRILSQKGRLQPDFGANPLAFAVSNVRRMIAPSAATELRSEISALNLLEMIEFAPGSIADCSGNVDFESQNRHALCLTIGPQIYAERLIIP